MKFKIGGMTAAIFAGIFLVAVVGQVAAKNVESVFQGKILVLNKRPPSYFSTKSGFVKFLRKNSTKVVYENEERTWEFETMAFFRRPLGDYEVEMVFYDIADGRDKNSRRFVNSFVQYTQDRNTRSLAGKTRLIRPDFDAHKKYLIIAQSKGKELAQGEFATRGTSQAQIDAQKRMEAVQKKMEADMKELQRKAKEQEEAEKRRKRGKETSEDLF